MGEREAARGLAVEDPQYRPPVVNVVFRDEELIPDEVIDFVNKYRQEPWVQMLWFAVPLASTKYVMGARV